MNSTELLELQKVEQQLLALQTDFNRLDETLEQAERALIFGRSGVIGTSASMSSAFTRVREARLLLGVNKKPLPEKPHSPSDHGPEFWSSECTEQVCTDYRNTLVTRAPGKGSV